MRKPKFPAPCHPQRPHLSRGLCEQCYHNLRNHGLEMPPRLLPDVAAWFDQFVATYVPTDECIDWPFAKLMRQGGYGAFRGTTAHRAVWKAFHRGKPGPVIRHTCDRRTCINPRHLKSGTHQQNMDDAVRRDRLSRGERRRNSLLTDRDVRVIRRRHADGEIVARIARDYPQVNPFTLYAVTQGRTWKHVK